ncbi:MAG TPA: hypothetical protein VGF55_00625 [Gemmataceae bacterium]|jgi:hypothetical protein
MSTGLKLLITAGVFGAGILTFALGVVFLGGPQLDDAPAETAAAPEQAARPFFASAPADKPAATDKPAPADPPPAPPAAKSKGTPGPKLQIAPDQGWTTSTMWGLAAPRKLTGHEKAALNLLGTADSTNTYKFNRVTLDDGSTIPAMPAPTDKELKEMAIGPIKQRGMADGFEAAILALAPRGLYHLTIQVSETPDWKAVEALLGKPDGTSESDIYLDTPQHRGRTHFRVAWMRYGWLEFGVGQGKVRAVRAEMRFCDVVAAESVPGGRSAPDPAKAATAKKPKPHRSPTEPAAEVDALKLLGHVLDAKVTTRHSNARDPKLDALVRRAPSVAGQDVYPAAIEFARQLKTSIRAEYLVITPSKNPSIGEVTELLGDPNRTESETTTIPGQKLTWHRYFWLDFGVVAGRVMRVRLNCLMTPVGGL